MQDQSVHGIAVPHDDDAVGLLRAWLAGDDHEGIVGAEAFQDGDTIRLRERLRACVARKCLKPEEVSSVWDLAAHSGRHVDRLSQGTVRALGLVSAELHRCNSRVPEPVMVPPMVAATVEAWGVSRWNGRVRRVHGWMLKLECFGDPGDEPSQIMVPMFLEHGYSGMFVEADPGDVFELWPTEDLALDAAAGYQARFREKQRERRERKEQEAARGE